MKNSGNCLIDLGYVPSDLDNDFYVKFHYLSKPVDWSVIFGTAQGADGVSTAYGALIGTWMIYITTGQNGYNSNVVGNWTTLRNNTMYEIEARRDGYRKINNTEYT